MVIVLSYLIILNLILFFTMGWDKRQARREGRRVPEKRLFLLAVLGGSIGGLAGMYTFHHKTRHWYFKWGFSAILALQLALALVICWLAGVFAPLGLFPPELFVIS